VRVEGIAIKKIFCLQVSESDFKLMQERDAITLRYIKWINLLIKANAGVCALKNASIENTAQFNLFRLFRVT